MKEEFDTPILYLIFNRPDLVKQTFPQIKAQRPRQLFIGSDGPRVSNENDQVKCAECRDWVMSQIDWDCEVKTLFRGENLGCGLAVSQAITWFFEHVEMGIILEDDIYVEKSFFEYCANLLRAYRNDDTIMHVGGCNFGLNQNTACGYFMSIYNESWGWATWKRAWLKFRYDISHIPRSSIIKTMTDNNIPKIEMDFWLKTYDELVQEKQTHIWDYQWTLSIWFNEGLTLLPAHNLIHNVGFGEDATHTFNEDGREALIIYENNITPNCKNVTKSTTYHKQRHKLFFPRESIFQRSKSYVKRLLKILKIIS